VTRSLPLPVPYRASGAGMTFSVAGDSERVFLGLLFVLLSRLLPLATLN
jgi:hypothetical protein